MSGSTPTVTCPHGHASSDTLVCSVCGSLMPSPSPSSAAPELDMTPARLDGPHRLGSLADKLGIGTGGGGGGPWPDPAGRPLGTGGGPRPFVDTGSSPVVGRPGDTGSHPSVDGAFAGGRHTGSHPVTGDTGPGSFSSRTFGRNGIGAMGDAGPGGGASASASDLPGRGGSAFGGRDGVGAGPGDGGPVGVPSADPGGFRGASGPAANPGGWTCSNCSAELDASAKFCEVCGYDPTTGSLPHVSAPVARPATDAGPAPAGSSSSSSWPSGPSGPGSSPSGPTGGAAGSPGAPVPLSGLVAVVTADEDYYRNLGVEEVVFPYGMPARTIELPAGPVAIGRRSRSRGTNPAIDLAGPPEDPAVSHTHASLIPAEDGTWRLVDHGSTNGTYLNESPTPVPPNQPLPVGPGDRVYVGAWTKITLERR